MNNLLSYCGLVDPRISASEKDLPVHIDENVKNRTLLQSYSDENFMKILFVVFWLGCGIERNFNDFKFGIADE